ncbi:MAG: protein kinase, partial [Polyangiaceae bacterium]
MAPDADHHPGEVLEGRYRLTEPLGRGGFGDVWRAEELLPDVSPLREVALKLLRPHAAGQDWAAEARIIASLRHPALVTIYAAGELALSDKTPFVAMELLEGDSLQSFVRGPKRGPVPWRRVVSWARQAAAALDTIHVAGVVHLDLKPANLFLTGGDLKVLDFGIARQGTLSAVGDGIEGRDELSTAAFLVERERQTEGGATVTASRYAFGTPGFMAPEIIEGGEATSAADAYALAALVVQLVTGRLPQRVGDAPTAAGASAGEATNHAWVAEVQAATLRGELRDLHGDERLPPALAALCERWLSLDPAARELEAGGMRGSLDDVWNCPHGRPPNPYRGLDAYGFVDEGRLYGREAEIARLGQELESVPTLVFQGAPGSGLTSLALAGVVPALAKVFADERDDWLPLVVSFEGLETSEQTPDERLSVAVTTFLEDRGATPDADAVSALLDWIEQARLGVVIVLDDLHEVLPFRETARSALASLFEEDANVAAGIRVLATLRSGEGASLLLTDDLGPRARPWLRVIGPPQSGTVDELLLGPARAADRPLVEPEVITKELRAELADDGARLGLVSLALEQLWDASDPRAAVTASHWRDRGGFVGHLRAHADATIASLAVDERAVADAILLRLVSVHGEAVHAEMDDVIETAGPRGRDVVETLGAARLVVETGATLRLAHPVLVDAWPRLHDLRLRHLDRLGMLEEIRDATRRWQLAGQARDLVWPPARLREVERRREVIGQDLGEDELSFLDASRRAQRLGWAVRALGALALVGIVGAMIWVDRTLELRAQQQRDDLARERERRMVSHMVTRSRRSDDPYLQTALLVGAMREGSDDPALPLELAEAARALPAAEFLTLSPVSQATFPWGPRWLMGLRGTEILILDFEPPAGESFAPAAFRYAPHVSGVYDFVPFAFDSAFVTRGQQGEVAVWRLMEDGRVELAARAPMTCLRGLSPVLVAERAPVVACTTDRGVAVWDLRRPHDVVIDPFMGRGLHLSPDGRWLAATRLKELLLWSPSGDRRQLLAIDESPKIARFSPRDQVIAVSSGDRLEVVDLASDPPVRRHEAPLMSGEPVDARWGPSGVDLAVCDFHGDGHWYYLRRGGRADEDLPPPPSPRPCRSFAGAWPRPLLDARDYGTSIAGVDVGPRLFDGGWQLEDGRLLTRDLALFDPDDRRLGALLRIDTATERPRDFGASVVGVVRDDDQVAWGVGDEIRLVDADGEELLARQGRLLGRCPDGRIVGLRKEQGGRVWTVFGLRHDVRVVTVRREPAFVLGVDPACRRLHFQGQQGRLGTVALEGGAGAPVSITWSATPLGGYVYDVRPSPGWAPEGAGLWLATSDGVVHRL